MTPRITRGTCAAITSSLPIPFCTLQTAPSAKTCAVAAIAAPVKVALVATSPSSHGGIARGIGAGVDRDRAAALDPQPVALDRRDVLGGDVVRPHLRVLGQPRGEQAADRAAADDADPHAARTAVASAWQTAGGAPPIPSPATTRPSTTIGSPPGSAATR